MGRESIKILVPDIFLTGVKKLVESTSKYVYGSVAEQVKYDPYEENHVLKSKKIARNNTKIKWKIVFNIFVIFGLCSLVMFRYAEISQLSFDNNKLNKEYVRLQNENTQLSFNILEAMDLKTIRDTAEIKLDMHKPDKSQIIYINVPKSDITIVSEKKPESGVLNQIQNNYKKIISMLN